MEASSFFIHSDKVRFMQQEGKPYQSPRQRVWLAIRENRNDFTVDQVASLAEMKVDSARDYIRGLARAGIIKLIREEAVPNMSKRIKIHHYALERDYGYSAPQVRRDGSLVEDHGNVNRAMWNTLRITKAAVNAHELAVLSSHDGLQVSEATAGKYLQLLFHAGYLRITTPAHHAVKKAKYQLLPNMNTGAKPPQIKRSKQVFDPNTNTVMFQETPALEEELKHGTLLENTDEE